MYPDGYIQLKDRSKDIIISGGENISSIEVEDALYKHPAISVAAVVAKPDDKWGETPCAFIELRPGESLTKDEVIDWCRQHMAHYKVPRHVVFTDLPKTSTARSRNSVCARWQRRRNWTVVIAVRKRSNIAKPGLSRRLVRTLKPSRRDEADQGPFLLLREVSRPDAAQDYRLR